MPETEMQLCPHCGRIKGTHDEIKDLELTEEILELIKGGPCDSSGVCTL